MSEYKEIANLNAYVQTLLQSGAPVCTAEKIAYIIAHPGLLGERVLSWSADANGTALLEKEAVVSSDTSGHPDWIATKADMTGRPVIDRYAHPNQWIICDSTFRKKYTAVPGHPDLYCPKSIPQRFVLLPEAIHIVQWGEEWNVDAGGYINITDPEDFYVISGRDFSDTYRVI